MLRVRWLGRVPYREAHVLQRALFERAGADYLLMMEHPHVFTLGARGDDAHVLVDPVEVGADLVRVDRGGDVTYHGPGQLVAYPILSVAMGPGAVPAYVHGIEQVVIDALGDLGLEGAGRLDGYPGVWVDPGGPAPRKICAIGVRVSKGRSMHGLALNVDPDLSWFERIVPCGITDKAVTSLAREGLPASMGQVVEAVVARAARRWAGGEVDRQEVVSGAGAVASQRPTTLERGIARLKDAGVEVSAAVPLARRKPPWMRVEAHMGHDFLDLRRTMRSLGLVTVCEEAGCPNIFECWDAGTATFMINGERCTRSCGFCLVDTRHPLPLDPGEPDRVAEAVERMRLRHAVVTTVARDDLPDGGAAAFAATVAAIRRRSPATTVEILISDLKGDASALGVVFASRPDVLNHNVETVARLQRAVRPQAGYARSLAVLAAAKDQGLVTKSGLMVGLGEERQEVLSALEDMRSVGVDIVTIGQYLRPSESHLPVARWWPPDELAGLGEAAMAMGFSHVESSPLSRSSYHAGEAVTAVGRQAAHPSGDTAGQAAASQAKVAVRLRA